MVSFGGDGKGAVERRAQGAARTQQYDMVGVQPLLVDGDRLRQQPWRTSVASGWLTGILCGCSTCRASWASSNAIRATATRLRLSCGIYRSRCHRSMATFPNGSSLCSDACRLSPSAVHREQIWSANARLHILLRGNGPRPPMRSSIYVYAFPGDGFALTCRLSKTTRDFVTAPPLVDGGTSHMQSRLGHQTVRLHRTRLLAVDLHVHAVKWAYTIAPKYSTARWGRWRNRKGSGSSSQAARIQSLRLMPKRESRSGPTPVRREQLWRGTDLKR